MASKRMALNFRRLWAFNQKRTMLSNAYKCNDEWESRRTSTALKDVDIYDLHKQMVIRMQTGHLPTAVDLDVAANSISHDDQIREFEELLWKFRHSINSSGILASTHHAVVRFCLKLNLEETLMKYLNDPINYGIFPDAYSANLIMDHFLQEGNHRDAAKVACFLMLQEDFDVESTRLFAILSCLRWIKDPKPEILKEKLEDSSESEELIFRVPWLKNPFFDDHFDLIEFDQLLGKTLIWMSDYLPKDMDVDKQIVLNCKLLGYTLRGNVSETLKTIQQLESDKKLKLHKDVGDKIESTFSGLLPTDVQPPAQSGGGDKAPNEEKPQSNEETKKKEQFFLRIKHSINSFKNANRTVDENFVDLFLAEMTKQLSSFEKRDIERQKELFAQWNSDRDRRLDSQIQQYLKKERLKIIDKQLEDLKREEDYLFFFENKEKLEKKLSPKIFIRDKEIQPKPEIPKDEDYTVPEIKKRHEIRKDDV